MLRVTRALVLSRSCERAAALSCVRAPNPAIVRPSSSQFPAHLLRSISMARQSVMHPNELAIKERKKADSKKGGKGGKNQDKNEDDEQQGEELDYEEISASMEAIVKKFIEEIASLRVGKADVTLLDKIFVMVGGKSVPLKAIAQVSIKDGATLSVAVFDQANQKDALSAIRDAKLDLNPTTSGNVILVPVPKPTKEFKDKLVKMAHQFAETSKLNIRNARRTAMDKLKKLKLPEDENRTAEKEVQRLHDKYVKQIDELLKKKEQELLK